MLQAFMSNNYACLQVLVSKELTWQSSCVIANNAKKQQKGFVQGYDLEVHDVLSFQNLIPCFLIIKYDST